jgi:uncharacterized protein (DUF4415 family)
MRKAMKKEYDFSKGKRGAVLRVPPGKTRVTIRLDDDILDWFRQQVDDAGGGNYQTLINEALRGFTREKRESLETTLRRVIRDEIRRVG